MTALLEAGWVLSGRNGAGRPIRLVFGDTELSEIYLGLVVGRHPALCDRARSATPAFPAPHADRHGRGQALRRGSQLAERHAVDGEEVPQFQPVPLTAGQELTLGRVVLEEAPGGAVRRGR